MQDKSSWSKFWDESVSRSGHTGYGEAFLHRYDQPVRLESVRHTIRSQFPGGLDGCAVLDIGCGTGDFIALSLSQGAEKVDGVDVSKEVLIKAASRFSNNQQVNLLQGSVTEKITERDYYDLITSITVLQHHVEDSELIQALSILRDALKPNGKMVVLELAPNHEVADRQYNLGVLYLVERPPHVWHALFKEAKFRVVSEPVMPQFGIACLRWINRTISLVYKPQQNLGNEQQADDANSYSQDSLNQVIGFKRRFLRKSLHYLRKITLCICYPVDHWLRLSLPPARYRTYRMYVLEKSENKA